jgi:hypothetical protein
MVRLGAVALVRRSDHHDEIIAVDTDKSGGTTDFVIVDAALNHSP